MAAEFYSLNDTQPDQPSGIGSSLESGLHSALGGIGAIGAATGLTGPGYMMEQNRAAQIYSQRAGQAGIPQTMDDVHSPVDLLKYAGGQVLESAPVLGEAAVGGLVGGPVGAAAATYPAMLGANLSTQYDQGGKFNLPVAAATAVPEAALNAVAPEARLLRGTLGAVDATGSRLANAAIGAGVGAASQGGIGAAQAELSEVNRASVDPSYDLLAGESLKNVADQAVGGAVAGGLIQGAHSGLHTPGNAGGVSSRDVQGAADTPDSATNPPDQPVNNSSRPAYQRMGRQIPGITDQFTGGTDSAVGDAMQQQDLDLQGGRNPGPFSPGFDAKGNPLQPTGAPADAIAATQGPGPARSEADAIAGLQAMHRDVTAQLAQTTDPNTVKQLNDTLQTVEQHLQTLKAEPAPGQRSLDFSDPLQRQGAGIQTGAQLFTDQDGLQQLDTAKDIATSSAPPPQPATQPIQVPPQYAKPAPRVPGQLPTPMDLANRRVPPEPGNQVVTPEQRPGFQLQGHPTPQFDEAAAPARPQLELQPQDGRQGQLPLEQPATAPLPNSEGTAARPNDTHTADMFGGGQNTSTPWQTRMRIAWKDVSDGKLQGFHKAMASALEANSADEAAAAIREKANDQSTNTSFAKLDAVHRALTGEGIEEGGAREAREAVNSEAGREGAPPAEGDAAQAVEPGRVESQAPPEDARVSAPEAEAGATPEREAAVETPEAAADTQPQTDYQKRAADVQSHVQALETTRDPAEFQQHVNALYRIWQDRAEGDRASHTADIYLHDPENGVTDDNLKKAADQYDQDEINNWVEHNVGTQRATGDHNPDTGNRTMLPDAARVPGAQHTAGSMMRTLSTSAKSPAVRMAMQLVSKYRDLNETPIHIVRDGDRVPSYIEREFQTGADAVTAAHGDGHSEIWVRNEAADEETMAHEILHAALPHALEAGNDGGATALMSDVRRAMQEAGILDTPAGKFFAQEALRNPNEFLSYGMSSPAMQHLFAQMEKPGLWDRFKAVIGKVLSVPKAFLDRIMGVDGSRSGDGSPTLQRLSRVLESALQDDTPQAEAARMQKYRQTAVSPEGAMDALKEGATDIWGHLRSLASKVSMASMPTHAIADQFEHRLPALRELTRAIDDRTSDQHAMARKAAALHDTLGDAYKAAGKSLDRFNSVMEDTQIAKIDPRVKGSLDRAQLNLLQAKSEFDKTGRAKDATPLQRATAARNLREATAAARLADTWGKMTPAERKAVGAAFDTLKESMARRTEATNAVLLRSADGFHDPVLDEMRANGASQEQINDQILRSYGRIFNTAQEPYAPLRRYGDWVTTASSKEYRAAEQELREARIAQASEGASGEVTGPTQDRARIAEQHLNLLTQDPDHRIVEFHDSSVAASKRLAQLKADHPDMQVARFARADYMQHAGTLSGGMINRIIEAVGEQLPPEMKDNIGAVIREMYVDSLPDNSFDQSMQGRAGVAGYSTDFSRGILDTLMRDSFNISTIEHGDALGAALKSLDEQRRADGGDNANNIFKELSRRVAFTTDHQNFRQWEQRMSEVTHAFYLGFSPGFMLMNGMQMPLITMPMLYARYGLHANAIMQKAIADTWDALKLRSGDLDHTASTKLTDNEKEVITRLQNLGLLNMTQLHDTAMAARASNIIDPQTKGEAATKAWENSKDIANLPAQWVEAINRGASALAAYRLGIEGKSRFGAMDHGAAMDYATKIVRDSHVDYSAVNNASWLRAPGGRFLFQFKKYWLNMLSMVSSNMWDAFGHGSDVKALRNKLADTSLSDDERAGHQQMLDSLLERRAVARRTLAGLYGAHYLLTGAMGMPFAGTAMALSSVMRNWYNDPEDKADSATDMQNWLSGVFGVPVADTMMHGIFGGIFGVNAQRISMGDLANPLGSGAASQGPGASGWLDQVLLSSLGPTAGLLQQQFQGYDQMTKGNYVAGLEKMLPHEAAAVLRATQYADGSAETASGKPVTPTSNLDAIKAALGMQPEDVANAYAARSASADAKQQFVQTRKSLIEDLATARKTGGDTGAAQAAVDAFNQRNSQQGLRISMGDVLKAQNAIGKSPKAPTGNEAAIDARTDKGAFAK